MKYLKLYEEYKNILQRAADLNHASAVLEWDMEVNMPSKGANFRGRQLATLATSAHEILTGKKLERILLELAASDKLTETERKNVELSLYDYDKNNKLPKKFAKSTGNKS